MKTSSPQIDPPIPPDGPETRTLSPCSATTSPEGSITTDAQRAGRNVNTLPAVNSPTSVHAQSLLATASSRTVPGDALLHPIVALAVGLLLVNDHVLKAASPSPLTGKLSDFAGLAFFPLLLVSLWEVATDARGSWKWPSIRPLAVATVATAAVFIAAKTTLVGNGSLAAAMGWMQWAATSVITAIAQFPTQAPRPVEIAQDPTDLVALPALFLAGVVGYRRASARRGAE